MLRFSRVKGRCLLLWQQQWGYSKLLTFSLYAHQTSLSSCLVWSRSHVFRNGPLSTHSTSCTEVHARNLQFLFAHTATGQSFFSASTCTFIREYWKPGIFIVNQCFNLYVLLKSLNFKLPYVGVWGEGQQLQAALQSHHSCGSIKWHTARMKRVIKRLTARTRI